MTSNKLTQWLLTATLMMASGLCWGVESIQAPYLGVSMGTAAWAGERPQSTSMEVAGGFRLRDSVAFELGYLDLGDLKPAAAALEPDMTRVSGFNLASKAMLPIAPKVEFFAKLGLFLWETQGVNPNAGLVQEQGHNMSYGGGFIWRAAQRIGVNLEYKTFDLDDTAGDNLSVGLHYDF